MHAFLNPAIASVLFILFAAFTYADDKPKETGPKVGEPAPVFEAIDDSGKPWKSAEHVGKKIIVVYFYPGDLTPGCTRQACGFRDSMKQLEEKGIEVVGISGDSVANHQLFKKVHGLPFTLLADSDGTIAKKFGVPLRPGAEFNYKEKEGKEHTLKRGVTTQRWTFMIGKDGKIIHKDTAVNATEDSKKVLEAVSKPAK